MTKVLFLDIDGVMIPGRAYVMKNQTFDQFVTVFDPIAVDMVNAACEKQGRKIVLHSSWIRAKFDVVGHCVRQGINRKHFHDDPYCDRDMAYRYDRIHDYLVRHPEITDYCILDDEDLPMGVLPEHEVFKKHLLLTNFDEGISMDIYKRLLDGTFPV